MFMNSYLDNPSIINANGLCLYNNYTNTRDLALYINSSDNINYGLNIRTRTDDSKKFITFSILKNGRIGASVYDIETGDSSDFTMIADLSKYV